ncbi:ABC transporter substrate-binding protein [Acetobacter estunensis]|uniref:ABC transporter substrate-binding protein n=1 Tax=Acetobacter estunensis TaxID=104097 RepID=A0A967B8X2_9PROT|nr:penicillin-binding protein activator [Acetobacter estunensis]NHO55063.1 ABC transporter substrate-binding protein [Acetobacter estunensis]
MDRTCRFPSRKGARAAQSYQERNASVSSSSSGRSGHTSRRLLRHLSGVALFALTACSSGPVSLSSGTTAGTTSGARNVGVLLPLSGPNGALGNEMLAAARVAMAPKPGTPATAPVPQIDAHDTAVGGAAAAIQAAVSSGDGIILGPLTSPDTSMIAPVAIQSGVPVIAFTSDVAQGRPGVWAFGLSPRQQVERLVAAAKAEGRRQFAAFLPDTPLGHAMGDALIVACQENALSAPQVTYHAPTPEAINSGLATLSARDSRMTAASGEAAAPAQDLPTDLANALSSTAPKTDDATAKVGSAATAPVMSAPPFDALLLADTGLGLKNVIDAMKASQVRTTDVRVMGPGLWAAFAGKLGSIAGAWYAAPDPAGRKAFVQAFAAANHRVPKPMADLAYDAGTVAATTYQASGGSGYPVDQLTRPEGFVGADGVVRLMPDGSTERRLGIFEVQPGGGARLLGADGKPVPTSSGAS